MPLNPLFKQQVLLANNGKVKVKRRFRKWLYPFNAERQYQRELVKLFDKINTELKNYLYPKLDDLVYTSKLNRPDDIEFRLDYTLTQKLELITKALKLQSDIFLSDAEKLAKEQGDRISKYNYDQMIKVIFDAVKVNPILSEPYLADQLKLFQVRNTNLITKLNMEQLAKMNDILYNNLSQGNSAKIIKDELEKTFNFTKKRAKLIARDQTNKFNGNLAELRQGELGIDSYTWSGVLDERERKTHRANEAKVFKWSSPSPITGHPGSQIQCRCTAQPVINDAMFD